MTRRFEGYCAKSRYVECNTNFGSKLHLCNRSQRRRPQDYKMAVQPFLRYSFGVSALECTCSDTLPFAYLRSVASN